MSDSKCRKVQRESFIGDILESPYEVRVDRQILDFIFHNAQVIEHLLIFYPFFTDPEIPRIQQHASKTTATEEFEKALQCSAEAFPIPFITWYKDGKKLNLPSCSDNGENPCEKGIYTISENTTGFYKSSTLKIRKSKFPRDQGAYTCEAKNDRGSSVWTVNLDMQGEDSCLSV